jgi:hypothetical protein
MKSRMLLVLGLLLIGVQPVLAQRWTISPFAGYRFGGSLQSSSTDAEVLIDDNLSYGIELDVDPMDSGLKFALLYSHQGTTAQLTDSLLNPNVDVDVDQIMVGAIQELYDDKFRPFVGAYVGATYMQPTGYENDLKFGFGLAVGMNYYITKHFGVRLDLRGFGTLINGDTGFLCADGSCLVEWSGSVMWQGEAAGSIFVTF